MRGSRRVRYTREQGATSPRPHSHKEYLAVDYLGPADRQTVTNAVAEYLTVKHNQNNAHAMSIEQAEAHLRKRLGETRLLPADIEVILQDARSR